MKIKNSKFSKALSLVTSVTLLLGTVASLPANAAIATSAEKTVTEDFGTTQNLVYERSDFTTGMEGFAESGADLGAGTKTTVNVLEKNRGVFDGAYMLGTAAQNQGWLPMWCYDADSEKLVYRKKNIGNFMAPYRFTGTGEDNVTALKEFSGRIYTTNFSGDNNAPYIAFNYVDNGNVDMVYPYISGNSLYFRLSSVRTETVDSPAGSYKRIYTNRSQPSTAKLDPVDATVNGVSLKYLDFKVVYGEGSVTVTFSDASNSVSQTFNDSAIQSATVGNINSSVENISKKVGEFNKNDASKATQVGFVAANSTAKYVDDLKLTYVCDRSAADMANEYKDLHSAILTKDIDAISEADTDAYNAALSDYDSLTDSAKALLTDEKAKLDSISNKLSDGIVDKYLTDNASALALTTETANADNVALATAALDGFNALDSAMQAKATAKFNANNGTSYASLADFLKQICNSVYYNADGALVYEDFGGYTKADGAWGETDYRTIAKRGDKRIKSAEYVMEFDTAALETGFNTNPFYAYDSAQKDQYFNFTFSSDKSAGWKNKVFFNGRSIKNLGNGYVGSHIVSDVLDAENYSKLTLRVRYTYDYTVFDGEPQHFWNATKTPYTSNYITVNMQYSFDELPGKVYKSGANYLAIVPKEGETLTDIFNVGFNVNSLPKGSSLKSLSIEYVDGTASPEFEAYEDTYSKTVANVALADKDNVNAALAVYETLTDAQKEKYKSNYENLTALSAVIKAIEEINAVSVSTPDAITKLSALKVSTDVYNNTNIAAAIESKTEAANTAFRPTIDGATIKTSAEPTEQNLRFTATLKNAPDGWYIKEAGVVMLPQNMLSGDLTAATAKAVIAKANYTAENKAPSNFLAQLSGSALNESRCARDIAARVYVIYTNGTDDYTYYSTNNGNNISDGVAIRSVYSVARSMAKAIVGTTEYGTVTYTETVTSTSTGSDIDSIDGKQVLAFVSANVKVIAAYVAANQNG